MGGKLVRYDRFIVAISKLRPSPLIVFLGWKESIKSLSLSGMLVLKLEICRGSAGRMSISEKK